MKMKFNFFKNFWIILYYIRDDWRSLYNVFQNLHINVEFLIKSFD